MSTETILLLQYPVLAVLFISQALYMRQLFSNFRTKVYMDVMDFLIIQARRAGEDTSEVEEQVSNWGKNRRGLHLVRGKDQS